MVSHMYLCGVTPVESKEHHLIHIGQDIKTQYSTNCLQLKIVPYLKYVERKDHPPIERGQGRVKKDHSCINKNSLMLESSHIKSKCAVNVADDLEKCKELPSHHSPQHCPYPQARLDYPQCRRALCCPQPLWRRTIDQN